MHGLRLKVIAIGSRDRWFITGSALASVVQGNALGELKRILSHLPHSTQLAQTLQKLSSEVRIQEQWTVTFHDFEC